MITLTLPTLLRLVAWRGGEPHTVLADTPVWRSPAAVAELDERARAELAHAPNMDDLVEALVVPRAECYGWFTTTDGDRRVDYRVLAVVNHSTAYVLTVGPDDVVTVASARPTGLVAALLAWLPRHPPALGRALNAPKADFDRAITGTPATGDLAELARIVHEPRLGGGTLYTAVRTDGGRRRSHRPVTYLDTPDGRWLTQVTTNADRTEWVTFAPATPALIADRLTR